MVEGHRHGRVPRAVRREQLLDNAERLFIDHGYGGFSIEDLCRASGVSRPIVYEYFGSKDGVFLACIERIRLEFEDHMMQAAAPATSVVEALRLGATAFFTILERDPGRWSLVYGGTTVLAGDMADQLLDLRAQTVERIADIGRKFAPGADEMRVLAYAHAVSGSGEQLGRWWLRNRTISQDQLVEYHCAFAESALSKLVTNGSPARVQR